MTIKNIRVIDEPPRFSDADVKKAEQVFESVIPRHKKFEVYFYRLLLFPNNLALIGTTDLELDSIILDLDKELNRAGVPDDKKYLNSQYFFSNVTLARFYGTPSEELVKKVEELSQSISFEPYTVDSVTLLTGNAVFVKKNVIHTWNLK
jgi:2'-5' RNA ligase